jgi:hypothetical protein
MNSVFPSRRSRRRKPFLAPSGDGGRRLSISRTRDWWMVRSVLVSTTLYVSRMASKMSTQRMPDCRATCTGQSGSSGQCMTISVRVGSAADLFRSRTLSGLEPTTPASAMTISSTSCAKSNLSFPFERRGSKGRSFQCSVAGGVLGSRRGVSAWFTCLPGLERTRGVCDVSRLTLRQPAVVCLRWFQGGNLFRRGGIAISVLLYQRRPKDH